LPATNLTRSSIHMLQKNSDMSYETLHISIKKMNSGYYNTGYPNKNLEFSILIT